MCSRQVKLGHLPSGGSDMGGLRQYMWYPRSQSSQNRSWSWKSNITGQLGESTAALQEATLGRLTSFSEVPHMLQHLHSMHCQRYVFTAAIMMGVNCRQDGWPAGTKPSLGLQRLVIFRSSSTPANAPERPQSEQDTSSSDWPVLWLVLESPKQKSQ